MVLGTYETYKEQIAAFFSQWGMTKSDATRAAEVLAWADIHGIDSHGIALLPDYYNNLRKKRLNIGAVPTIVKENAVSVLLDGEGGLGQLPALLATEKVIGKAKEIGVGIASVRNSGHFGALGYYTLQAARNDLIGISATSVSGIRVPPTGGAEPRLGTDPISFAAPDKNGRPFVLDMATTTVAAGRVRNKLREGQPLPAGWAMDKGGRPTLDAAAALLLTPLGGSRETAGYKGYGLATMVNILTSCLSGSTLITDPEHTIKPKGIDISHFFLAIDPQMFRPIDEFKRDVQRLCDDLRATSPLEASNPVMVAGDPERAIKKLRSAEGIPLPPQLELQLRNMAAKSGTPWLLGS